MPTVALEFSFPQHLSAADFITKGIEAAKVYRDRYPAANVRVLRNRQYPSQFSVRALVWGAERNFVVEVSPTKAVATVIVPAHEAALVGLVRPIVLKAVADWCGGE